MSTKAAAILGWCIIVAAVLHAWIGGFASAGRYQVVRADSSCLVIDTRTGKVWQKFVATNSGPSEWSETSGPWAK